MGRDKGIVLPANREGEKGGFSRFGDFKTSRRLKDRNLLILGGPPLEDRPNMKSFAVLLAVLSTKNSKKAGLSGR